MWLTIKKVVRDCSTEIDGKTYCPFRVGGLSLIGSGIPTFIGLAIYSTVANPDHHFDMIAFGTAFGAMMTGIGLLAGGVTFKARGELPADNGMNSQQ
jgi:hypothetical protein